MKGLVSHSHMNLWEYIQNNHPGWLNTTIKIDLFPNKYEKSLYSLSTFIDHAMLRAREAVPFRGVSRTLRSCSGEGLDWGGVDHSSGVKSSF